jgi:hypothetical protein
LNISSPSSVCSGTRLRRNGKEAHAIHRKFVARTSSYKSPGHLSCL